jgi:tetratricopeptide (TPR) repeat protein
MAEELQASAPEGINPLATSLALTGASRAKADAFLDDQRHHMHEQLKQIHLDLWEKKLGVMLRLAALCLGLAVIIGLAVAIWNATRADGLVVEALSVPPRFMEAGISGEVVADDLMTKVGTIRSIAVAQSLSDSKEVSRDRDQDIKVEIPETGVSLGQAWHYLRLWLGHERRVTGSLRAAGDGTLALTITLEGQEVFTATGNAADLGKLEQQAAEHLFAAVDPLNYCLYLLVQNRLPETLAAAERATQLVRTAPERADAYSLFAYLTRLATGDMALVEARTRLAMAIDPKAATPHVELIRDSILLGHDEEGLAEARALPKLRAEDQLPLQRGRGFQEILYEAARERDIETGDFAQVRSENCVDCSLATQSLLEAEFAARSHDAAASRALIEKARAAGGADKLLGNSRAQIGRARYFHDAAAGDWRAATADARAYAALLGNARVNPKLSALQVQTLAMPLLAQALAGSGDLAGAGTAIAATPGDCYNCIRTRGLVAAAARQWGRGDYWFARAVQAAPSVPFAYHDWGRSLLARGKPDEAIAQFKLSYQKGPHFADALEGWGEALMVKNQSHLALAKFAEAEKYAPNWGRLHLKWGEALAYAGKRDEAKKQFARAAALDLTPSEKSELARANHV